MPVAAARETPRRPPSAPLVPHDRHLHRNRSFGQDARARAAAVCGWWRPARKTCKLVDEDDPVSLAAQAIDGDMVRRIGMDRVKVGALEVSRIVYGMMRLAEAADTSPAQVQARIEACLAQGITTMDQADIYGDYGAETPPRGCAAGVAPGLRDRLEIITKCDIIAPVGRYADRRVKYYDTSAHHITASVEMSLKALGTDRIDLLLLHRPDPLMHHEGNRPGAGHAGHRRQAARGGRVELQAARLVAAAIGDGGAPWSPTRSN